MAKKTVVAQLPKRDKSRPMAYVARNGDVKHFRRGQKKAQHKTLAKGVVGKQLLKARKALKVLFYVKGSKVMQVKNGLKRRGRRGGRRSR